MTSLRCLYSNLNRNHGFGMKQLSLTMNMIWSLISCSWYDMDQAIKVIVQKKVKRTRIVVVTRMLFSEVLNSMLP